MWALMLLKQRTSARASRSKVSVVYSTLNLADNAHLKILVPSVAAGAIIGKNGEAITNIQNSTGAKVKLSKANDFYPGSYITGLYNPRNQ